MIFRQQLDRLRGLTGLATLLLAGAASVLRPSESAAQAIGTMQVTARVHPAPEAWPALAATAELAARATGSAPPPTRVELELARLTIEDRASGVRRLRIRIDYLRN